MYLRSHTVHGLNKHVHTDDDISYVLMIALKGCRCDGEVRCQQNEFQRLVYLSNTRYLLPILSVILSFTKTLSNNRNQVTVCCCSFDNALSKQYLSLWPVANMRTKHCTTETRREQLYTVSNYFCHLGEVTDVTDSPTSGPGYELETSRIRSKNCKDSCELA
jgi:hypothetical protein